MQEEIYLYLLARPRSVSDMIRALTDKRLSEDAAERRAQIPRIAGNWFKKESGYLWRLREAGRIRDQGKQWVVDRERLVEDVIAFLGVERAFPTVAVDGDDADVADAYHGLVGVRSLRELKQRLLADVFEGAVMEELFRWDTWGDVLFVPNEDERRIRTVDRVFDTLGTVHLILVSGIVKARRQQIRAAMEDRNRYFAWKNRMTRLDATADAFAERVVERCFPWAGQEPDGTWQDRRMQRIVDAFGQMGGVVPDETLDVLADLYLLALEDGTGLFEQRAAYGGDHHLLFDLLERGWLVPERGVERDDRTGNIVLPLGEVRSYLDRLVSRVEPGGALRPR